MSWPVSNPPEVRTEWAVKRWGHGRGLQLLTKLWCALKGHRMREWTYDWPEYDDEAADFNEVMMNEFHPGDDEALYWYRGCLRGCGCVQDATCTLKRRMELPA